MRFITPTASRVLVLALALGNAGDALAQQPESVPAVVPAWKDIFQAVQSGRCSDAVPMLEAYVGENPEAARAFYFLGHCRGVLGQDAEALAALDRALSIRPDLAGVSVSRGKLLARAGKRDDAEQAFRDEIQKAASPELVLDGWSALADLLMQAQQDVEARSAWEKVIELAPSHPEAYAAASAIDLRAGRLDEADAVLERGAKAGAGNAAARLNVGIAWFNKKELAKAAAVFEAVAADAAASPGDVALAWGLLGKTRLREGRNADAIAAIKRSLEADPAAPMAQELRDLLRGLEKPPRRK